MHLRMDTSKDGLSMFFNKWQVSVINLIWDKYPEGSDIKSIWDEVNRGLIRKISRSSVTKFVNKLVDSGLFRFEEEVDRGGARRIYYSVYSETTFKKLLIRFLVSKLLREFPEETRIVINRFR